MLSFILFLSYFLFSSAYLNKNSWQIIKKLKISYPQQDFQEKIDKIILNNYQPLVKSKSSKFKYKHYYKCKRIPFHEITLWGQEGLLDAIKNYNYTRNTNFANFASKYIDGTLHKGLTNQFPINKMKKYERRKRNFKKKEIPIFHTNYYKLKSENINEYEYKSEYENMWIEINKLDKKIRRIFYLKFDCQFNKIRTNKQVAQLMCYSEEHIRKIINNTILQIKSLSNYGK